MSDSDKDTGKDTHELLTRTLLAFAHGEVTQDQLIAVVAKYVTVLKLLANAGAGSERGLDTTSGKRVAKICGYWLHERLRDPYSPPETALDTDWDKVLPDEARADLDRDEHRLTFDQWFS